MKALSVIGITKSGKTTTIENIIKELIRRGFSVGSIKEIHYEKFAIDTEGSNTYRHAAAGAEVVTARGYKETDILFPVQLPVEDILRFYVQDYVVMEGVSDYNVPVILCAHSLKELEEHKEKDYFNRVFAISGVVADSKNDFEKIPVINAEKNISELVDIIVEEVFDILPDFDPECCSACGYNCRELTARILHGISKRADCKLSEAKIILSIDGKSIGMVPFVQSIMKDTIKALVSNLKGYRQGKKIEITLND
jgi:molybdopterin-guanine dinucleotide biosynthesis protein B